VGEPASPRALDDHLKDKENHHWNSLPPMYLLTCLFSRGCEIGNTCSTNHSSQNGPVMGPTGNYLLKFDAINGISHLGNLPQSTQLQWDLYIIQCSPVFFSTLHNLLSLYLSGALSPSCCYPPHDFLLMLFSFFPLLLTYILPWCFLPFAFGCCLGFGC